MYKEGTVIKTLDDTIYYKQNGNICIAKVQKKPLDMKSLLGKEIADLSYEEIVSISEEEYLEGIEKIPLSKLDDALLNDEPESYLLNEGIEQNRIEEMFTSMPTKQKTKKNTNSRKKKSFKSIK